MHDRESITSSTKSITSSTKSIASDILRTTGDRLRVNRDRLRAMVTTIDAVIDVSARLREIRDRLAQLNQEKTALEQERDRCLDALAASTSDRLPPPEPGASNRDHILAYFRRFPKSRFTAIDLWDALHQRVDSLPAVRTLLSRMADEGKLTRVRHGVYILRP